jgi:A/G-specific adenine glycosylase
LPGIGAYTSAAVAAIAFGEKAPAVDTNVARVIARLEALEQPGRGAIERRLLEMMHGQRPGDVVQAMMDLGASVCRPMKPRCDACPLAADCAAFASGAPEAFPAKRAKAVRPQRHGFAYWIERAGSVWLVRRPAKGLLGGMAALPGSAWGDSPSAGVNPVGSVRHVFTHFSLELQLVAKAEPEGEGWWQQLGELESAGLPTLYRKAADLMLGRDDRLAA